MPIRLLLRRSRDRNSSLFWPNSKAARQRSKVKVFIHRQLSPNVVDFYTFVPHKCHPYMTSAIQPDFSLNQNLEVLSVHAQRFKNYFITLKWSHFNNFFHREWIQTTLAAQWRMKTMTFWPIYTLLWHNVFSLFSSATQLAGSKSFLQAESKVRLILRGQRNSV